MESIKIGSIVKVKIDDVEKTYVIISEKQYKDSKKNKQKIKVHLITRNSPLGKVLMGRKIGNKIKYGNTKIEILSITKLI